ncbi:MAG: sigma-E processing peptidase SpoIIGA [Bacilli bacterium]|nr:sigma-E processing peptidase SpoIIGA [Bacilli bacterium]
MVIYIDLLIALNLIYDFLILKVVSIVLKRNTNNMRIFIASIIGEISILFLVLNFNYILLFICKIFLAILLNIITFNYKSIKYTIYNLSYFYMISIILGGFIYFLYLKGINYIIIMLLIPIILFIYVILQENNIRYQHYYEVIITFVNNHKIKVTGYLDTGNTLRDPISLKPIIIVDKNILKGIGSIRSPILVPVNVLNNHFLLTCFKVKNISINSKIITNVLIGISESKINIDGVGCLLNNYLRKEIEND